MSLEQDVLVELSDLRNEIAVASSARQPKTSQGRMTMIKGCASFHKLVDRGPALIPILAACYSATPKDSLAPLIRSIVGPVFDVPDEVYANSEATYAHCARWLDSNASRYKKD